MGSELGGGRLAIVGGGIAGLTLAAGLDPARFEVTVFEAQPERVAGGAALGLWPSARRALDELGVTLPAAAAFAPGAAAIFSVGGRRLLRLRPPPIHLVDRPALMAALADAVPESVVRITREIDRPELLAGPARPPIGGPGGAADVVVGADGVRSRVRGLVHPAGADRRATPWVALRGIRDVAPAPGDVGEYWGRGRLFGLAPVGDSRSYWFTAHRSDLGPEPLALDAVLAEARAAFAGDAGVIAAHLDAAGPGTLATRIWTTPPLRRYVRGPYVVIGDAAHAAAPNLGRGACDAILDAASLAATLNAGGSLRAWQARRLPPTQLARVAATALARVATGRLVGGPSARAKGGPRPDN